MASVAKVATTSGRNPEPSNKGSNQRGGGGRKDDDQQHRYPQRESDSRNGHPHGPLVEHEVPIFPEGLADYQGSKEGRRKQSDDRGGARGQLPTAYQHRSRGLDCCAVWG